MNKKVKIPTRITLYSFIPSIMFLALAIVFATNVKYTEMAIAVGGTIFGPAVWVYNRDLAKAKEDHEINESKITRVLIAGFNFFLAGIAWMNGMEMVTGLLLVVSFGQIWFIDNATISQRMWHGLIAAIVGIWGFMYYRPVAIVFFALSIYFAYDFIKMQKAETKSDKSESSKSKKKKKKK